MYVMRQNPDNILDEQINALNLDSILEELSERSPETSKYLKVRA